MLSNLTLPRRFFAIVCSAIAALAATPGGGAAETISPRVGTMLVMNNPQAVAPPAPVTPAATSAPAALPAQLSADIVPALSPDSSLTTSDLWQRIRNGFAMNELNSPLIARHEQWYANRPEYVARLTERSQRYLYYIVEEVEKRGMPTELALLPMIESAFNPEAYSLAHASGIWQFMPGTGKKYGLQQNWWYDGRRDIISATNSALDYLQKLYDQFGDWELALAAYNWGEGAVQRAQERNRRRGLPVNYASLKMPDETRNYIPKLLAVKNIISDPARFGLTLQAIPNKPYFAAVTTRHHIDVKLAAQLADISMDEFNALNPGHNRPVILDEHNDVLLPVEKVSTFLTNLESYSEPLVSWKIYQSAKGERLDQLAPRFGLSLARLKSINGLPTRSNVSNGQTLLVPMNADEPGAVFEPFNTHLAPSTRMTADAQTHVVRKGETLKGIARRYHVSASKLKSWNPDLEQLSPGQSIIVAQAGKPRHAAKAEKSRHVARAGKSRSHSTRTASTSKNRKHIARKQSRHVHVAYNR